MAHFVHVSVDHPGIKLLPDLQKVVNAYEEHEQVYSVDAHPLLKDLVAHHGLRKGPKGRLRVENDFAVTGMESGQG